MKLTTSIWLDMLGVMDLLENITTIVKDRLGLNMRGSYAQLAGKTVIVTGGNTGVGYATAEALLRQGANVVLACLSVEHGQVAAKQLEAIVNSSRGSSGKGSADMPSSPRVEVELLDLASLASVREFVQRWESSGRPLDLLVCNAGIMCPPERVLTRDGYELQWQTNHLSHFMLANTLVRHQRRKRQLQQRQDQQGQDVSQQPLRVLFLTSVAHFGADLGSDLADMPYCHRDWHSFQAYCNSKMCTLLAAKEMDRRFAMDAAASNLGASGRDAAVAVHPGLVDTFLARNYFKQTVPHLLRPLTDPFFDHLFCPYLLRSPGAAAETVLYAATAPAAEVGGQYCGSAPHVSRHLAAAGDPALAQQVWDISAHLCQLRPDQLVE